MMVLAVTLYNIPEGMAVGVVYAGYLSGSAEITITVGGALACPLALQYKAGAMMYVVVGELIPEMSEGEHSNIGVVMAW